MIPANVNFFALASAIAKVTKENSLTDSEIYNHIVTYYTNFLNQSNDELKQQAKCEAMQRPF